MSTNKRIINPYAKGHLEFYQTRERKKLCYERFKTHCRQFTAFMFSNVGITLLVIFYTIAGAFIFQTIEMFEYGRNQNSNIDYVYNVNASAECLEEIWKVTAQNFSFYKQISFRIRINDILLMYQRNIVKRDITKQDIENQWSFSGAFLYSLTIITTIGYGNISPRSDWGKLVTILYAIIGMPLFLLYLSNIGDVLAKSFKWIYSKVCLCRICPGVARRRLIREHRKLCQLTMQKIWTDMERPRSPISNNFPRNSSPCGSFHSLNSDLNKTQEILFKDNIDDINLRCKIQENTDEITVPLTVCVFIMISYIMWGALLFGRWEDWNYLDGCYFCFISLSSIGFGDLVPGERVITADKDKVEVSFILCAMYLLLGMALIAMCFNLMQEQVIHSMRTTNRAIQRCCGCT